MPRLGLALALGPLILSLSACALFRGSASEEPVPLNIVRAIPPQYHGQWSPSLGGCAADGGNRSQWTFVSAGTLGGVESIYEATQIAVGVNSVEVTTAEVGVITMRELGPGRVQFVQPDGASVIAVRCPQARVR